MANIPSSSRNKLNYRPNIKFIEPAVVAVEPTPVKEIGDDVPAQQKQDELLALTEAVDILGAAVQERINEQAKNMKVKLDPSVDVATIQAMCRLFGNSDDLDDCNFLEITYDQYRECREKICKYGQNLVEKTRTPATFDESLLTNGGMRPELSEKAQVIKPLDMKVFSENLFKLLVRHLWKQFIRKPLKKLPVIGKKVPKQLPGTKLNRGFKQQLLKAQADGVKVIGL